MQVWKIGYAQLSEAQLDELSAECDTADNNNGDHYIEVVELETVRHLGDWVVRLIDEATAHGAEFLLLIKGKEPYGE